MITNPNRPASSMTKREEFAKAAMQGIIAASTRKELFDYPYTQKTVDLAIEFADKILNQLGEPNPPIK